MTAFKRISGRQVCAALLLATWSLGGIAAPRAPEVVPPETTPVMMPAIVQSRFHEDDGARLYVRLKLRLATQHPFTTLTYRVPDRTMWTALRERSHVEFSASRSAGENTVTAIRVLP